MSDAPDGCPVHDLPGGETVWVRIPPHLLLPSQVRVQRWDGAVPVPAGEVCADHHLAARVAEAFGLGGEL